MHHANQVVQNNKDFVSGWAHNPQILKIPVSFLETMTGSSNLELLNVKF